MIMSIEIIESPRHRCEACGCLYSFDKEDFKEDKTYLNCKEAYLGKFRYVYEYRTFVTCPVCGKEFELKRETKYLDSCQ